MKCPKDNIEMSKEFLLDFILHKCEKCGDRKITDFSNKPISHKKELELLDVYNEN